MITPGAVVRLPVYSESGAYSVAVEVHGDAHARRGLLCLPGILETQKDFQHLITQLHGTARIFSADFAGRGQSDHLSSAGNYRMSGCVRDACALYSYALGVFAAHIKSPSIQALLPFDLPKIEMPNIHLIGNSMGGLIAIFLAAQRPAYLRSLVINDVGSLLPWASLIALFSAMGRSSLLPESLPGLPQGSRQLAKKLQVDEKLIAAIFQPTYLDLPYRRDIAGLNFQQVFHAIEVPVLIIYSTDSPIVTRAAREAMRMLPPNYSFLEVEGNTHPVAYGGAVTEAIQRFMGKAEKEPISGAETEVLIS